MVDGAQPAFKRHWTCAQLPPMEYRRVLDLQRRLVQAARADDTRTGVVLFLEHFPVMTLGRRGGREHLCVSESFLRERGIDLVHAERGGDVTYHGPGQLVAYPVVHLRALGMGVVDFVGAMEEVMLRTAHEWGIAAERNHRNRGLWVGGKKLGSIGIAVRRGVTFHGMALNVNLDLRPFGFIHPCGLEGIAMTSMEKEAGQPVFMPAVRKRLAVHMAEVFGVRMTAVDRAELERELDAARMAAAT